MKTDDEDVWGDEPAPTEEELEAARALAESLERGGAPAPGSLAETALRVRATVASAAPLEPRLVTLGIEEGLARRRRSRRLVAASAFAAAAIALVGVLGTLAVRRATLSGLALEGTVAAPPAMSELRFEAFPEGQRASERVDRMARAASADWLSAELARASSEAGR